MLLKKCVLTATLALLSIPTFAVFAAAPAPSVSQIDYPGAANLTDAIGINNRGEIVGVYADAQFRRHGYIFRQGAFTALDIPDIPGASTIPSGINDRGQIVGWYVSDGFHGFLWNNGRFIQIEAPDRSDTFVDRINNRGQIVLRLRQGFFAPTRGYLLTDGTFTPLNIPEVLAEETLGLNDRGQIVGSYLSKGLEHAFLLDEGVFTPIDVPGAVRSTAHGINNRGQIVGSYRDAGGVEHGYLRNANGSFTVIDAARATGIAASGINEGSDIVGQFSAGASFHGFLWAQ